MLTLKQKKNTKHYSSYSFHTCVFVWRQLMRMLWMSPNLIAPCYTDFDLFLQFSWKKYRLKVITEQTIQNYSNKSLARYAQT